MKKGKTNMFMGEKEKWAGSLRERNKRRNKNVSKHERSIRPNSREIHLT